MTNERVENLVLTCLALTVATRNGRFFKLEYNTTWYTVKDTHKVWQSHTVPKTSKLKQIPVGYTLGVRKSSLCSGMKIF